MPTTTSQWFCRALCLILWYLVQGLQSFELGACRLSRASSQSPLPNGRTSSSTLHLFNMFRGKGSEWRLPEQAILRFNDEAPTLSNIEEALRSRETEVERVNFEDRLQGRGPTNAQSSLRLFDSPDGFEPEVTLYRDTAAWCPYCEKVWLQLEEKQIPYRVEKVPLRCYGEKPRSFFQVSPRGGLPAATIKGKTLTESNDIMFLLEKEFPSHTPMYPHPSDPNHSRAEHLLRLERQVFSCWFGWLTSSEGESGVRKMHALLQSVDHELSATVGPYFLGDKLSLVDIMFTPFLERMAASLPYYKGFESRSEAVYPHLYRWYVAMDQRPTYQGLKSDYYTHCHDLPPQIGDCISRPSARPFADRIDGGDWTLQKRSEDIFEPMLPVDVGMARREAVRNTLHNFEAVVRFTTRPFGQRSGPSAAAPLADPDLQANLSVEPVLHAVLRTILHTMVISPVDGSLPTDDCGLLIGSELKPAVRECLVYLRDRIGVPRDMSVHAAQQLRAHLNWFIDAHL